MGRDPILPVRLSPDMRDLANGVAKALGTTASDMFRELLRQRILTAIDDPGVFDKLADVPGRGNLQGLAVEFRRQAAKAARLREVEAEFEDETAP